MNLPANLPAIATSASATRAERLAEKDAAGPKFDDILLPRSSKAALGTREERGDKQTATWSWTRIDLAKNKLGWNAEAAPGTIDETADLATDGSGENATDTASAEEAMSRADGRPSNELGEQEVKAPQEAQKANDPEMTPTEPVENTDEDRLAEIAAERAAAERLAAVDMHTRTPVQDGGEARQGAAMATGDDRRAEAPMASRERAAPFGDRIANAMDRVEPAMREAGRSASAPGIAERLERLSQRLNAEGEPRRAEVRIAAASKSGAATREDLLRNDTFARRVTVVASQNAPVAPAAPAPAPLGISSPSLQVTAAIREDVAQVSRAVAAQIEAQDAAGSRSRPIHTLQIQLQPADLGRVNARMSIEGSQLRVELQVETEQARAALAKDADSILKSLKAAGFEIDRVTIQQAQPASNATQTGTQERGANAFVSQDSSADESGNQGRQRGAGNGGHTPQEGQDGAPQNDTRGGLFI